MLKKDLNQINKSSEDLAQEFEGSFGKYKITLEDKIEVKRYRISVLICGTSFTLGLLQWLVFGPNNAWIWLLPMAISLGLALQWIHIYIKLIHQVLKVFWTLGAIAIIVFIVKGNPSHLLSDLAMNHGQSIFLGPFFAALTGLGFKEFFCFRQNEAIGLTLLLPTTFLGHCFQLTTPIITMSLLSLSALLLLILGIRKFGMDPALDIGDKSVFEYLKNVEQTNGSGI